MAMAHSLETRMPFLDRSIVEFALRLPSRFKAHRGREKVILGGLARRHLPPEIAARRKKGLAYPSGFWLRPPCREFARGLLLGSRGNSPFDTRHLERNVPRWLSNPGQGSVTLAKLVSLQSWWNEFFRGAA
jgi:asparagine synthase (glutamine-hydrolysing)